MSRSASLASKSLSMLHYVVVFYILVPGLVSSPDEYDFNSGYPVTEPTIVENATSKGAICFDGSPPAYHIREGFGAGKDKWVVYLLGGVWCPSVSDCYGRLGGHIGSSLHWNDIKQKQRFGGILHNISKSKLDFYSRTKVMVRYCDASSFTGEVKKVDQITGLHFRGIRVFDAIVDHILSIKRMKDANEVLKTGGSAGGLAVIIHCDRLANHFLGTTEVKCLSDSGFFLHSNNSLQARGLESMFLGTIVLHNSTGAQPNACFDRKKASGREE